MIWLLACTGEPEPAPHSHEGAHSGGHDSHGYVLPDECVETAARDDVAALDQDLDTALTSELRWDGWRISAAHIVVAAEVDAGWCLGSWHDGDVHWALTPDAPVFLTSVFGYWFGEHEVTRDEWADLFTAAQQPDGVADALTTLHADRAVLLPLDAGIDGDTLHYLGLHEAFHVHVQSPVWQGRPLVAWSSWDVPTDRSAIAGACYDGIGAERSALDDAVTAADNGGDVCTPAGDFLSRRASRYEALDGVLVGDHSCARAEAIMEVVEGVPEWWYLQLALDSGELDQDAVQGKLSATSGDAFYKTGAGQVFLLTALGADVPGALESSTSWEDGSLTAQLTAACPD